MKKITALLFTFCLTALSLHAQLLFSDNFSTYSDGLIETDGLWYCYSPASPHLDAFVADHLLILNSTNYDGVAAPTNNFTPAGTVIYASFTINVTTLPTRSGGYFAEFKNYTNNDCAHIFLATTNTVVPGTYRLAMGLDATDISTHGVAIYPMDLATNTTYQVVYYYDENNVLGQLWVNPATSGDTSVSPGDSVTNNLVLNIAISQIGFSQYENQGVADIGDVMVGNSFGDVVTNVPQVPVIGIQPVGGNFYTYDQTKLYVVASGTSQLNYQWYSNTVPLSDNDVTVTGSLSNVLSLADLQATANYSVVVANATGSVTSSVATVTVITTPTPPFFTEQPYGATNSLFADITLTGVADGTGPMTYQWYFEPTNLPLTFTAMPGQTNTYLDLDDLAFTNAGQYYVEATGGDGSTDSSTSSVVVTPPLVVTIGELHSLMQTGNAGNYTIGLGQYVTVSGWVTGFGPFSASTKTYAEFYIQDGTGGIYCYLDAYETNTVPQPGTYVTITGPCQAYDGQLEIDPDIGAVINGVTNGITISTNAPYMPAPQPVNFALLATNPLGVAGINIQCSLVTLTNVYIYGTATGGAVPAYFYTNGYTDLYLTEGPYNAVSNPNTYSLYVPAYGYGYISTNFWGQPVPTHCYQLSGVLTYYSGASELDVTRPQDFVVNTPSSFSAGIVHSNSVSTVSWPAATGSTYSVYNATNITGPWTQTFGLSYYPVTGIYEQTNGTTKQQFYRVSTP